MRIVEPRRPWQIPFPADAMVCSALARSRQGDLAVEGCALRAALVERLAALDPDGDVSGTSRSLNP